MRIILSILALSVALITSALGQGFVNLDFESGRDVSHEPMPNFLDWNVAVPGWSHGNGNDASRV